MSHGANGKSNGDDLHELRASVNVLCNRVDRFLHESSELLASVHEIREMHLTDRTRLGGIESDTAQLRKDVHDIKQLLLDQTTA